MLSKHIENRAFQENVVSSANISLVGKVYQLSNAATAADAGAVGRGRHFPLSAQYAHSPTLLLN
jgi:hypothetical protein